MFIGKKKLLFKLLLKFAHIKSLILNYAEGMNGSLNKIYYRALVTPLSMVLLNTNN